MAVPRAAGDGPGRIAREARCDDRGRVAGLDTPSCARHSTGGVRRARHSTGGVRCGRCSIVEVRRGRCSCGEVPCGRCSTGGVRCGPSSTGGHSCGRSRDAGGSRQARPEKNGGFAASCHRAASRGDDQRGASRSGGHDHPRSSASSPGRSSPPQGGSRGAWGSCFQAYGARSRAQDAQESSCSSA